MYCDTEAWIQGYVIITEDKVTKLVNSDENSCY